MRLLKTILLVFSALIVIYFTVKIFRSTSVVDGLTELQTPHFVISYQGIYEGEAQEVVDSLERNYDRIRGNFVDIENVLNVSESNFEKGWVDFVDKKY